MLKEKIRKDQIEAMKNGDRVRKTVLSGLISVLKNKEIDKGSELNDDEIEDTIISEAKKRKDSMSQFEIGGRKDLVQNEENELKILMNYLPEQMPEEEIRNEVESAISKLGASSLKDMGKVIGFVMKKNKGKADGESVGKMAREILANK